MNIKPAHKTTLRAKQLAPKFMIDLVQLRANYRPDGAAQAKVAAAHNFDYNVAGARADIDALIRL